MELFKVDINEELKRLIIHGLLHLTGMTHRGNSLKNKMIKVQEQLLKNLMGETII
ncbi:MAG: rRNA maturation RNAse YbeY [Spirochaetota bacterium]